MLGPELMCAWRQDPPANLQRAQTSRDRGLVARAAQRIFRLLCDEDATVTMSYLQICCERVYDLLQPALNAEPLRLREERPPSGSARGARGQPGEIYVEGLVEDRICTVEDCFQRLAYGLSNVAFRATNFNEQSSRSHVVLTFTLQQVVNADMGVVRRSRLHLVDLAGCE